MADTARLPIPITENWDWQVHAACRGLGASVFFHPDNERGKSKRRREDQAKAICAGCPVRKPCLDWALDVGEFHGVWGGTSPEERLHLMARSAP
jgi:WhiB family redox-sensing transcriptional regulator